jgi:hypothetical protein
MDHHLQPSTDKELRQAKNLTRAIRCRFGEWIPRTRCFINPTWVKTPFNNFNAAAGKWII